MVSTTLRGWTIGRSARSKKPLRGPAGDLAAGRCSELPRSRERAAAAAQDYDRNQQSEDSKVAVALARLELSWALTLNNRL